jgi:Mrp family chromosome partitioning ATPase
MTIIERAIQAARARAASTSAETAGTGEAPAKPARGAGRVTPLPRPTHDSPDQVMPFPRFDAGGSLVTEVTDPKIYEQFRRLKRPLLQCAFGPLATPGTQTIMITSPLQGAGKTFVSSNLAYALALEKDRNVLLIDTDNANPTLTRQMGLIGRPGLYDLISDTALTLEQVVCQTDIPGLWILPAGKTAPDSLELLNSHRCQEIFQSTRRARPQRHHHPRCAATADHQRGPGGHRARGPVSAGRRIGRDTQKQRHAGAGPARREKTDRPGAQQGPRPQRTRLLLPHLPLSGVVGAPVGAPSGAIPFFSTMIAAEAAPTGRSYGRSYTALLPRPMP